jgi:hypothetical protein
MIAWQQQTGPFLIAIGLCLGFELATYSENSYTYASTIAINSTYEIEVENMTSEQFDRLMNAESKANDQTNQILNSIQTLEGLDIYSNDVAMRRKLILTKLSTVITRARTESKKQASRWVGK